MKRIVTTDSNYKYFMYVVEDMFKVGEVISEIEDILSENIYLLRIYIYTKDLDILNMLMDYYQEINCVEVKAEDDPEDDFNKTINFIEWFVGKA